MPLPVKIRCALPVAFGFLCLVMLEPVLGQNNQASATDAVSRYLDEASWNALFPHRYALDKGGKDFYSFKAFKAAVARFPGFLNEKDEDGQKKELAAFLANISQETSGGWDEAPGGYFAWGLYFVSEDKNFGRSARAQKVQSPPLYADTSKHAYPPVPGKAYYGRGPVQLSWNVNYGQFSQLWFGDKNVLLNDPDSLLRDPVLAFGSAIWFWMTAQPPKPSCHAVMAGEWVPTADDISKGRVPGFGATVNIINGGVECGSGQDGRHTLYRYAFYRHFCSFLKVAPGENVSCASQRPFGQ